MVYHRRATWGGMELVGICANCGGEVLESFQYTKDYGQEHYHTGTFICVEEEKEIPREQVILFEDIAKEAKEEETETEETKSEEQT